MALKIKWSDDRVKGTMAALLLIGRERLARGETENLVAEALAEYRADPDTYKANKKSWPEARDTSPLKKPSRLATYQKLIADTDKLLAKWTQAKRHFNSLLELDNALIEQLSDFG
jgi:uncharacterized protein YjiS (DUF1127 family)